MIGWHLGNVFPLDDRDWLILQLVPPSSICFLPGEGIGPDDVRRVLEIAPHCAVHVRPYLDPNSMDLDAYLDRCKRFMDQYAWVPSVHLSPFNEQNMPRWANWEGFGDQYADMVNFNREMARFYRALKAHNPRFKIGWSPLTPGNRDVWFPGDPIGHYYMHDPNFGPGPCQESLALCDFQYAHVYIHEGENAWSAPYYGTRFTELRKYNPKDIWIKEAGFPTKEHLNAPWAGQALVSWIQSLSRYPYVKGVMLWMLGRNWGGMWYDGDKPRREVYMLRDIEESFEEALGREAQKHVIPLNPDSAFEKAAKVRGVYVSSPEFDYVRGGVTYRAQVYRGADRSIQHIVSCVIGDWGNLKWIRRSN